MAKQKTTPTDGADITPPATDTTAAAPETGAASSPDTPASPAQPGAQAAPQRMVRVKVLKNRMVYAEFEHARGIYLWMPEDRAKAKETLGEVTTDI